MSVESNEIRIQAIAEQAKSLDESLENARADQLRFEGGKQLAVSLTKNIRGIVDKIRSETKEGTLSEDHADIALYWVGLCQMSIEGVGMHAGNSCLVAGGKVAALSGALAHALRRVDGEKAMMAAKKENGGMSATMVAARAENPDVAPKKKPAPKKKATKKTGKR